MPDQSEDRIPDRAEPPQRPDAHPLGESRDDAGRGRERSRIGFPYNDLRDATELAQAIHGKVGHGTCDDNQLAAWVNQSSKSSGFRTQVSAAKMFGLIESEGGGQLRLSPRGQRIVDPERSRQAQIEAFLSVPLYKAAYDKYKGTLLPPNTALELEFVGLGVAEKQKDRARSVFTRSADQAGFFEHGKNKLVQPGVVQRQPGQPPIPDQIEGDGGTGGRDSDSAALALDPLLMALLHKIPTRSEGWTAQRRLRWFRTFAMNVSQVYDEDGEPIELKIDLDPARVNN